MAATELKPLPGYGHFLWLLFMQPVTLHHWLKQAGIDPANDSLWHLWRHGQLRQPALRHYLARCGFALFFVTPALALFGAGLAVALGFPVSWLKLMEVVAVGVAGSGVLGVVFGVAVGVAVGVAGGVEFGVAFGVAVGVAAGIGGGVAFGVVVGVVDGVAGGIAGGVAGGIAAGIAAGIALGIAIGVASILSYARIPLYVIECLIQWLLHLLPGLTPARRLAGSPVLRHDLSYFPHPFLADHIVAAADDDPALVQRVLAACAIAPGQRNIGTQALAHLQARQLARLAQQQDFLAAAQLQGAWLPGSETPSPALRAFADVARYGQAALATFSPSLRLGHLRQAERQLVALDNLLLTEPGPLAQFLPETLRIWQATLGALLQTAQVEAGKEIDNPFVAGDPLEPGQTWGREVFRGRETMVRQVEELLAADASCSIALIGPRRCGKTSLLKMLPALLPDALVVFFDVLDNPINSPGAFYSALVTRIRQAADRQRRVKLPPLAAGPDIESLRDWLAMLEDRSDLGRVLICIDEFERLESLFPGEPRDLLQFMGLLRATIQHRRRVRLLVAGAAPFDDLSNLWHDHFINLREIRLGFLDEATSVDLLSRPTAAFPPQAISTDVARAAFQRSGGQPYLTQFFGWHLVRQMNYRLRQTESPNPALARATLDDVAAAEEHILDEAANYLRNSWSELPEAARSAVQTLAQGARPPLSPAVRRALRRRLLIDEQDQLKVPLFQRYVAEKLDA